MILRSIDLSAHHSSLVRHPLIKCQMPELVQQIIQDRYIERDMLWDLLKNSFSANTYSAEESLFGSLTLRFHNFISLGTFHVLHEVQLNTVLHIQHCSAQLLR